MFRCHQSYCIPLFMVCDNISDCQRGQDEVFCSSGNLVSNRKKSINMEGLLRCRYDNIYIPSFHICDGVVHCLQSQVVSLSNISSQLITVYNKTIQNLLHYSIIVMFFCRMMRIRVKYSVAHPNALVEDTRFIATTLQQIFRYINFQND